MFQWCMLRNKIEACLCFKLKIKGLIKQYYFKNIDELTNLKVLYSVQIVEIRSNFILMSIVIFRIPMAQTTCKYFKSLSRAFLENYIL